VTRLWGNQRLVCSLLFVALSVCACPAQAADWLALVWQNDLFTGRDGGGYTNGLFVSIYQPSGATALELPLLIQPFSWMLTDDFDSTLNEHTIGQAMLTPTDISQPVPEPNDVPYAGLFTYRTSRVQVHNNTADMLRTTIGVVGPASMAEKSQTFIHKVVGSSEPQGWDHQLRNEPVFSVLRARSWRYPLHHGVDLILLSQAQLGNLETSAGGGATLRLGRGLSNNFATTLLQQGRTSSSNAIERSWFLYSSFEASYLLHTILVSGNSFRDSPSSDLRHQQLSFTLGASYTWDAFSVSLSYHSGTGLDKHNSSRNNFGSLSFAWQM